MRLATAAVVCLLLTACAGVRQEPGDAAASAVVSSAAAPATNPWSEPARSVLIEHCGQCHLGSLPTANRRAMAIYDLSEPRWDARLRPDNYPGITRRVNRQATAEQRTVVEKYIRCSRDRLCNGS